MKAKSRLSVKVEPFLHSLNVFRKPLIAAVSGGPDSVALLCALMALRAAEPASAGHLGTLVIAHLNHQLRSAESDADERFVCELHASLRASGVMGLDLRCERAEVGARAREEGGNLESVGRRIRYSWLARIARELDAPFVATGHTADDQAETVLHRLLRGTGLKGLRGIAARRSLAPGTELIRPLLGVTRAEVLAYLKEEGQAYREDRSNADLNYTRNRIRHELLPHLAQRYNPAIAAVLARLAGQAAEAYQDRKLKARALLAEAERPRAGKLLVFDTQRLVGQPRHLVREVFRQAWTREGWPMSGMGFREWDRLAAVAVGEAVAVDLPGGIRARCRQRVVQVGQVS